MTCAYAQAIQQGTASPIGSTVKIAPATAELHYQVPVAQDGVNPATAVDNPAVNTATLANRVAMEFYNAGSTDIEIHTLSSFRFGQGRVVKPNTGFVVNCANAPTIIHYALASGGTGDLRVTEVGQ